MSLIRNSFLVLIIFLNSLTIYTQVSQEEIIVTGSFIKEIQASNPIFTTSIDDINQRGTFRIEDYLSSLPMVNPENSALHSNFSTGISSVSIRGLGGDRSLVLIDGKRLPSGSPLDGNAAQDLNQVPFALIKKVEILTGGKSTIYGSDATGGVINFILDKKYSGTKISIHQGAYQHNNNSYLRNINNDAKSSVFDGINSNYSIIFGSELSDDSHLLGFIDYRNVESIRWDDRDIGVCAFRGNASCRLSSATFMARVQNGSSGGYVSEGGFSSTSTGFNFGAANFLQRPDKKMNTGFIFNSSLFDDTNLTLSFFNLAQESNAQIGAPLLFRQKINLPCTNPFLSSAQFSSIGCVTSADNINATVSKRFVENSLNRSQFFKTSANRGVIDLKGKIDADWNFGIYFQNSHTSLRYKYLNDISLSKVKNALNINSAGNCISNDAGCVPLNLFTTNNNIALIASNGITQDALDYVHLDLSIYGELSEKILAFNFDREIKLKNQSINYFYVLVGGERRENKLIKLPDDNFLNEDGAGQQTQHQKMFGKVSVNEAYIQLGLKLKNNFNFDSSFRYSDYSFGKHAFTYDFGFQYPISEIFSIKASHQKSIRIADIQELFEPEETELVYASDPCAGSSPEFSSSQCLLTGLPLNLYQQVDDTSAQLYLRSSGNLNLDPEESISNSISLIMETQFSKLEIDYYQINMEDQISQLNITSVINNCVESQSISSYWCGLINRANDGTLSTSGSFVSTPLFNLSEFDTSGIDLKFTYLIDTSFGELAFNNFTNILLNKDFKQDISSDQINCKSLYRLGEEDGLCYQPSPKIQNVLNLSLAKRIFNNPSQLGFTFRYIDNVDDSQKIGTALNIPFDSYSYFDLNFVTNLDNDLDIIFGINNILDEDPPINGYIGYVPGNANTFPAFYDALGRFIYFKISKELN